MQIKTLIPKKEILSKVKQLASKIKKHYKDEVYCIVVLKGAMIFFKDLKKELEKNKVKVKYSTIKLSSYKGTKSTNKIKVDKDIKKLKAKDILIVEDIIDSGLTLKFLKKHLKKKGATNISIIAFLDKKQNRKYKMDADYSGFKIPNKFVVGYGLDYNGRLRNLNYIGYIEE
jgi:hypoxanthine phosphoribosyltransferase